MKKISVFILLIAGIFYFIAGAYASDKSHSIKVTCSIPAVPGVNAPIAEKEGSFKLETKKVQLESGGQLSDFIQTEQKILAQGISIVLTSIYAR